jgi:hypothetical protein
MTKSNRDDQSCHSTKAGRNRAGLGPLQQPYPAECAHSPATSLLYCRLWPAIAPKHHGVPRLSQLRMIRCPQWVRLRLSDHSAARPLYLQHRTYLATAGTAAVGQYRPHAVQQNGPLPSPLRRAQQRLAPCQFYWLAISRFRRPSVISIAVARLNIAWSC